MAETEVRVIDAAAWTKQRVEERMEEQAVRLDELTVRMIESGG